MAAMEAREMTDRPGAIERYQEPTGVLALTDEKLGRIEKLASFMAKSSLVPKQYREADNPNAKWDLINVGITLEQLGVPFNQQTLNQTWVMDGKVNLMAQVTIAIAKSRGYDCWFEPGGVTEQGATICVRRVGSQRIDRYTYTIEMARRAGLLNEWVEKWESPSGGGGGKRYKAATYVVSVDGVPNDKPVPEWAQREINAGKTKRKDPWFNAREQMLMARAATMALRIAAPEALLGLPDIATEDAIPGELQPPPGVDLTTGEVVDPDRYGPPPRQDPDDEPIDAEIVDEQGKEGATEPVETATNANQAGAGPKAATDAASGRPAPAAPTEVEEKPWHASLHMSAAGVGQATELDGEALLDLVVHILTGETSVRSIPDQQTANKATRWLNDVRQGRVTIEPTEGGRYVMVLPSGNRLGPVPTEPAQASLDDVEYGPGEEPF